MSEKIISNLLLTNCEDYTGYDDSEWHVVASDSNDSDEQETFKIVSVISSKEYPGNNLLGDMLKNIDNIATQLGIEILPDLQIDEFNL
jgi:hypothetical protein